MPSRSSSGSFFSQPTISRAQDSEISPCAIPRASSGCSAMTRIRRTAAFASLFDSLVIAASQADDEAYPSASCASWASNRNRNSAWATASLDWISPRDTSASPSAAGSSSAAPGEFR